MLAKGTSGPTLMIEGGWTKDNINAVESPDPRGRQAMEMVPNAAYVVIAAMYLVIAVCHWH